MDSSCVTSPPLGNSLEPSLPLLSSSGDGGESPLSFTLVSESWCNCLGDSFQVKGLVSDFCHVALASGPSTFVSLLLLLLLLCWALDKTQLNDVAQIHSRIRRDHYPASSVCRGHLACPDHGLPESLLRIGALTRVHCLGFCGHNSGTSTECLTEYLEIGWERENVWDVLCLRRPVTGGHKSGCLRWQSFILRCDNGLECETQWPPPPPQDHILCEVLPSSSCS